MNQHLGEKNAIKKQNMKKNLPELLWRGCYRGWNETISDDLFFSNTWKDLKIHYEIMSYLMNKEKISITIVVLKSEHVSILESV